jgi:hypothetical protein
MNEAYGQCFNTNCSNYGDWCECNCYSYKRYMIVEEEEW